MIVCIWIRLCGRSIAMKDMTRPLVTLDTFALMVMREAGKYSPYGEVWVSLY